MNKKILSIIVILLMITTVAGAILFIFPYNPTEPPKADDTGSTQEGIQQVVSANNQFAFDLYTELDQSIDKNENIFFSPYSVFSAMAITYEGAGGKTAEEMKSVLHLPEPNVLRPNFAAIYNDINRNTKSYELRTGNALWVQYDYPLFEDYVDRVERYYGGKAANLDFLSETENSRQTINRFIEEQTDGKIKELISPDLLGSSTRLVITNAIYFNGKWKWRFKKSSTSEQDFRVSPSKIVKVQMMYMKPDKATFNYADLGDLQILELPYKGEKISMLILLPTGDLESIGPLTTEKLERWKGQMRETKLDGIYIPKFEFTTKYTLNEYLKSLGLSTAFSKGADFSGMTISEDLWIGFVIHQGYIKVDEEGTEAAAATSIGVVGVFAPRKVFIADHPFIFIIQERDTGNILFMGRVVDPSK